MGTLFRLLMMRFSFLLLALLGFTSASIQVNETKLLGQQATDYRGLPVWVIAYSQDDGSAGTVYRQDDEMWQLNDLLKKVDKSAPVLKATTQDDVSNYLGAVNNNDKLVASSEFHDFLSLNVNGSQLQNICNDLKFFTHGMMGFLDTLRAKIPIFAPPMTSRPMQLTFPTRVGPGNRSPILRNILNILFT